MRCLSLYRFERARPIVLSILLFLFLLSYPVPRSHAELRKRVLIAVQAADAPAQDIVKGALARELDRYDDILVIDDRFEQNFLPQMKYKAHVIVHVDVVQVYSAESIDDSWFRGRKWDKVPSLLAASAAYPVMGVSLLALPFVGSDVDPPTKTEGHFVANIALFDMSSERSFARTQMTFSFAVAPGMRKSIHSAREDGIILTRVAEKGFRKLARWISRETSRQPGRTWVFSESHDRAFVNAGSLDGVRRGQKLKIFRPYDIHAPGTTNVVGRAAEFAGVVRVIHVDELFSIAEPIRFSLSGEYITK